MKESFKSPQTLLFFISDRNQHFTWRYSQMKQTQFYQKHDSGAGSNILNLIRDHLHIIHDISAVLTCKWLRNEYMDHKY